MGVSGESLINSSDKLQNMRVGGVARHNSVTIVQDPQSHAEGPLVLHAMMYNKWKIPNFMILAIH